MTCRHASGWILAAVLCLPFGVLSAEPEECLALSANSEVASCADRYAPGSTSPRTRSEPAAAQPRVGKAGGAQAFDTRIQVWPCKIGRYLRLEAVAELNDVPPRA